ncbi:MAG TPA: hypothetical protein VGS08_06300 [Candidatus Saccharimonadales bacterium]|nr:hypothetical protein [Candidatus Saccharimonadales bacterium]
MRHSQKKIAIEFIQGTVGQSTTKLLIDKRGGGVYLNARDFFQTYKKALGNISGQFVYQVVTASDYGIPRDSLMLVIELATTL